MNTTVSRGSLPLDVETCTVVTTKEPPAEVIVIGGLGWNGCVFGKEMVFGFVTMFCSITICDPRSIPM